MGAAPLSLEDDVRLFVYRFMVDNGRPPMPVEIATGVQSNSADVEAALKRLADAHVLVLAPGTPYIWLARVVGFDRTVLGAGRLALDQEGSSISGFISR